MTNEERDLITRFIERVSGAPASGATAGSVPSTPAAGLAPVDPEADALIGQLMAQHPEARYRITQLAFVQEHALEAAQQRIAAMQAQMQQMQAAGGGAQPGASPWGAGAQGGQQQHGFLSSLFGGHSSAPPQPGYQAPPQQQPQYAQPQYAPQYGGAPAGMFQPQGSGFLGGALRTAAGVAGGLVAGQALMSLFEGNRGGGFGGFGTGAAMPGGGFESGAGLGTPGGWTDAGQGVDQGGGFTPDPYDQGGALKTDPASDPFASGQGGGDAGGWTPAADPSGADASGADPSGGGDAGWQDAAPDAGGWDSGSNSDDGGWTDSSSDA